MALETHNKRVESDSGTKRCQEPYLQYGGTKRCQEPYLQYGVTLANKWFLTPFQAQAQRLDELKVPPGNRLEALKGNRKGQHSIRINEQWRVCFANRTEARAARHGRRVRGFRWKDGDAFDVEIVDYH